MNALLSQDLSTWIGYIKTISGITLDESKKYLVENRLLPLAKETGVDTWADLYRTVRGDASGTLERRVVDAVTTGETSFFRDAAPFELLQHKIVPDLIDLRKKGSPPGAIVPLRIWSAACSTGQEVYSIGIVLRELLGSMAGYDVRILGTDISQKAIGTASYGKYSRHELDRGMPPVKVDRFFVPDGERLRIRDEVRALATFRTINLLEPFTFPHKFDIIFCRNVAIYFTEADRRRLFDRIGSYLAPDGYLVIGSTETLMGLCPQFVSQRYLRAVFYRISR